MPHHSTVSFHPDATPLSEIRSTPRSMTVATPKVRGIQTSLDDVHAMLVADPDIGLTEVPSIVILTELKLKPKSTANSSIKIMLLRDTGYHAHLSCNSPIQDSGSKRSFGRRGVTILTHEHRGLPEIPPNLALNSCVAHVVLEGQGQETPIHVIGVHLPQDDTCCAPKFITTSKQWHHNSTLNTTFLKVVVIGLHYLSRRSVYCSSYSS
jgi:hypothetical protein